MTTLPQQDTIKQYLGDGSTANFAVPFYVPLEDDGQPDMDVYVTLSGATPVPDSDIQEWGVAYTYTPNGSNPVLGGTLNFEDDYIPASGSYVTVVRNVAASLTVDFADATTFSGANLDDALNRLLLIEQQNKTYANQRNISYIVNSYLPDSTLQANVQIPTLADGQIWIGTGDGVSAATLEEGADTSVLRSELENENPGTDGARLVGYYDTLNATPTTVREAINSLQNDVTQNVPVGTILEYGGSTVSAGFLACDGAAVSRTTYAVLFGVIGTAFGAGDTINTFNVPNFERRVAVGSGGTGTDTLGNAVGNTGGEETHTQATDEVGAHSHTGTTRVKGSGNVGSFFEPLMTGANDQNVEAAATISLTINNNSVPAAMNIIQPSLVVFKMIKY